MKQSNLAKVFKALGNEQRLKLYLMLLENNKAEHTPEANGRCVHCCQGVLKAFTMACDKLSISRSTVSHHFKELQNAGLIKSRRDGRSFICEVNKDTLEDIRNLLKGGESV